MQTYRIGIKGQHCTAAGWVTFADDDPDATYYEGTADEIREQAALMRKASETAGAGHDLYLMRAARSLLEEIGDE